jgi:hypothetical protein
VGDRAMRPGNDLVIICREDRKRTLHYNVIDIVPKDDLMLMWSHVITAKTASV